MKESKTDIKENPGLTSAGIALDMYIMLCGLLGPHSVIVENLGFKIRKFVMSQKPKDTNND